jgi:hypothetical protein
MMKILVLLALVAVLVVFVVRVMKGARGEGRVVAIEAEPLELPYEGVDALFTPAERAFLAVLDQAVAGRYRMFGKVRLADLVAVRAMPDRSAWQTAFNRIDRKHVDFVGCDPADLSVKFVVELDDRSHQQANRRQRDEFVDDALRAARIPVFHVRAQGSYSVEEVRSLLFETAG